MTFRAFAGAIVAFIYNALISPLPSRTVRRAYLKIWLGGLGPGSERPARMHVPQRAKGSLWRANRGEFRLPA